MQQLAFGVLFVTIPDQIPEHVADGGVGAVVNFMLEQGFSKEEHKKDPGPWEPRQYRIESSTCFGISNNTLLKILRNERVSERSVQAVVRSLTRSLPDDHVVKKKWIECAVNQPQVLKTQPRQITTEKPRKLGTNRLASLDGVWVYILRRHNGEKFQLAASADYIVGIFQWQSGSISTAYNYGYLVEKDELVLHRNWTASDCGVGVSTLYIPYRSDYFNSVTKEAGVSGLIYAKYDGLQTTNTGRTAYKGAYYDTDTGLIEDGGEFYAEQFSQSVDHPVELTLEIARQLSHIFPP